MERPDRVEFATSVAPIGRTGRPTNRRARMVAVGWVVVLAGVAGIGLAGRDDGSPLPATTLGGPDTAAGLASAGPAEAAVAPHVAPTEAAVAPAPPPRPWPSATPHRSLGDDGVMGGLTFDAPAPKLSQAEMERDGYRHYQQLLEAE